eukprot:3352056-Rhodomonas_salina.1
MSHPSTSSLLQSRSSACWSLWCGVNTTTPVVQLIVTGRAHPPSPPAAQVPPSSCPVTCLSKEQPFRAAP